MNNNGELDNGVYNNFAYKSPSTDGNSEINEEELIDDGEDNKIRSKMNDKIRKNALEEKNKKDVDKSDTPGSTERAFLDLTINSNIVNEVHKNKSDMNPELKIEDDELGNPDDTCKQSQLEKIISEAGKAHKNVTQLLNVCDQVVTDSESFRSTINEFPLGKQIS